MRHYSRRTEQAYVDWVRRFILFHGRKHPDTMGAPEITAFVSWLATKRHVSASTQSQALSALLFLYRWVLQVEIGDLDPVTRAKRPTRVPVVLTEDEVARLLEKLDGVVWIVVALLYGSGLRLRECLELRVKDVDFAQREIVVRRGKGQKDRRTMLPSAVVPRLQAHLEQVRAQHVRDVAAGEGRVVLPFALDRKYPNAAREWTWQFVFPAARICRDPRWGPPSRLLGTEASGSIAVAARTCGVPSRCDRHRLAAKGGAATRLAHERATCSAAVSMEVSAALSQPAWRPLAATTAAGRRLPAAIAVYLRPVGNGST